MITLINGTYSTLALTLSENLEMNGISSGNDLDISTYFYLFRITDKMSDEVYQFLAPGTTMSSGDMNAGTSAWVRWNNFQIGLNAPGATMSSRYEGNIYLPDVEEGQWEYEVWAAPGIKPEYPSAFWIWGGSVLLEKGRLNIR